MGKEIEKSNRFFFPLSLVVGLFLLIALVGLCSDLIGPEKDSLVETSIIYQPAPTPGSDLRAIEANAEIKIPASAREIRAVISGVQDMDTWVRLDLPTGELDAFLRNARCTIPLAPVNPASFPQRELYPDWWQPMKATRLEMCNGFYNHLSQEVLADRSAQDIVRMYVLSVTADFSRVLTAIP